MKADRERRGSRGEFEGGEESVGKEVGRRRGKKPESGFAAYLRKSFLQKGSQTGTEVIFPKFIRGIETVIDGKR